jgi:hypothetical protein
LIFLSSVCAVAIRPIIIWIDSSSATSPPGADGQEIPFVQGRSPAFLAQRTCAVVMSASSVPICLQNCSCSAIRSSMAPRSIETKSLRDFARVSDRAPRRSRRRSSNFRYRVLSALKVYASSSSVWVSSSSESATGGTSTGFVTVFGIATDFRLGFSCRFSAGSPRGSIRDGVISAITLVSLARTNSSYCFRLLLPSSETIAFAICSFVGLYVPC